MSKRIGYFPRSILVHDAPYKIQLDSRGRAYAKSSSGVITRCEVLATRVGFAITGPDDRQFRILRRENSWVFKDLKTDEETTL